MTPTATQALAAFRVKMNARLEEREYTPICSYCGRIRTPQGEWVEAELTGPRTDGACPVCEERELAKLQSKPGVLIPNSGSTGSASALLSGRVTVQPAPQWPRRSIPLSAVASPQS